MEGFSLQPFPSRGCAPQARVSGTAAPGYHGVSFLAPRRGGFGVCSHSDAVQVLLPLFSVEGESWGRKERARFHRDPHFGCS